MSDSLRARPAAARPPVRVRRASLDLARSAPWFAALLLVAVLAFWPSYLSRITGNGTWTHLHAFTATLWMLMLIVQPLMIRARRLTTHRILGRVSYGLAPMVLLAMVLLAHSRIAGLDGPPFARQTYVLYLQVSLAVLFGLSYGLAVRTRRIRALHARFMICTGLTLIDPVVVRLMLWAEPAPAWNYQWFTFALTDLVLLGLIVLERGSPRGRRVFPVMLCVFVLAQLPALLGWTGAPAWQAFARWFASLPST